MDPSVVALAWETAATVASDGDHELFDAFSESYFQNRCIARLVEFYLELKARDKQQNFDLDNIASMVTFANSWLSVSYEKKWLLGETIRSKDIPTSLLVSVNAYSGIDDDLKVSYQLARMMSILSHVEKSMSACGYIFLWDDFVKTSQGFVGNAKDSLAQL